MSCVLQNISNSVHIVIDDYVLQTNIHGIIHVIDVDITLDMVFDEKRGLITT